MRFRTGRFGKVKFLRVGFGLSRAVDFVAVQIRQVA
jgi:hypothetical protein